MLTGHRWKVATVRGIPLYVSTSWVWIAALYVWSQYNYLTLNRGLAAGSGEAIFLAVFAAVLFFASILAHEAAHAVMARTLGLPVRGVTLVFWGGATETRADIRGPLGEFLVASVGPATTLVLSGVFWVAHLATAGVVSDIVGYLAWLSLIFAVLNALPGFPLDGGRMLLAAVWGLTKNRRTALRAAGWSGVLVGLVFGAAAVWFIANGGIGMGIFAGYIAAILVTTGRGMEQRIAFRDQLIKGTVVDAMRPPPRTIPATMSLAEALDHALRGTPNESFPVVDDDWTRGRFGLHAERASRRRSRPVAAGARRLDPHEPDDGARPRRDPRRGDRLARRRDRFRREGRRPDRCAHAARRRELVPPGDRGTFGPDGVRGATTTTRPVNRSAL